MKKPVRFGPRNGLRWGDVLPTMFDDVETTPLHDDFRIYGVNREDQPILVTDVMSWHYLCIKDAPISVERKISWARMLDIVLSAGLRWDHRDRHDKIWYLEEDTYGTWARAGSTWGSDWMGYSVAAQTEMKWLKSVSGHMLPRPLVSPIKYLSTHNTSFDGEYSWFERTALYWYQGAE